MFSRLIWRNSKKNRKENSLLFSALLVSILAFYLILSLSHQDIMVFLSEMESDAVTKLMQIVPVFYGASLFILFFLIYYAGKFWFERRRHEFGVYLMLGMSRVKLFMLLLAEDFHNSIIALFIGLPIAVFLSELISLITARMVGIGIVGHRFSLSFRAVLWTVVGFVLVKFAAFLILSGKISRQEIGALLTDAPEGTKKQMPGFVYGISSLFGTVCLALAYYMVIRGGAWFDVHLMGMAVVLGILGTMLLFWGLRFLIGFAVKLQGGDGRLHVFNFRQIHETVIQRSLTLAVCSLLILASLCCFGSGVGIARHYGETQHVLDYTFRDEQGGNDMAEVRRTLGTYEMDEKFSKLFEMRVGSIRTTEDTEGAFQMEPVMTELREMKPSRDRDVLLNNFQYETFPYLISLESYNNLLAAAGRPELTLKKGEAAVYMDGEMTSADSIEIIDNILKKKPESVLDGQKLCLTGAVQTTDLITDRTITLSFALILPEEVFDYYTQGEYEIYLNGILAEETVSKTGLMSAISEMNGRLAQTGLSYESYLQNMGRQLFYMVSASYITIYLAIIFLIIANTIIGVQFLMGQQKMSRRYRTLVRLGAAYENLCSSAKRQINWYFGIPVVIAGFGSIFGVRALLTGLLSSKAKENMSEMLTVSAAMIFVLCMIEYIYVTAVKHMSDHYLLTLLIPEREE